MDTSELWPPLSVSCPMHTRSPSQSERLLLLISPRSVDHDKKESWNENVMWWWMKTMILIQTWREKDGKNRPTLNYELRKTFYMYNHSKLADVLTNTFFQAAMRPPANRTSFLRSTTVHESLGLLDCSSDEETCERLVSAIVVQWSGPARCPEPRAQFLRA